MRRTQQTILWLGLGVLAGCPGVIDDRAGYEEYEDTQQPTRRSDAGDDDDTPVRDAGRSDAGGAGAGGGGRDAGWSDAGSGGDSGASASCNFKALMQAKCGNAGCHGGPGNSTGLDLTSDNLAARVRGETGSGGCADYLLVNPDDPGQSALYLVVTNQSCGIRMPLGGNLDASEQACILQWIENL